MFFAPFFPGRRLACVASLCFLVLPAFLLCGSSRAPANGGIRLLLLFFGAAVPRSAFGRCMVCVASPCSVLPAFRPFHLLQVSGAPPVFFPGVPQGVDVLDCFGS